MSDLEKSKTAIPVISAIIERDINGQKEILIQTRIADYDAMYKGTIEIAAGKIESFENIYETVKREVKEETGLDVIKIYPEPSKEIFSTKKGDKAFVFESYCCQQLLKGNISWVGFVFLCKVKGRLQANKNETKDLRWINHTELRKLIDKSPEKIFTLQLPVLGYYLKNQGK